MTHKKDRSLPEEGKGPVPLENNPEDHLMTIKEVADYLAIHEMTLYTLIHETDLPAMKLGGQWRFKKSLLDQWLAREMKHKHPDSSSNHPHSGHRKTGTEG